MNSRLHPDLARLHRPLPVLFARHTPHCDAKRAPVSLLECALTNRDACNPFKIRSYENCRVSLPISFISSKNNLLNLLTPSLSNSCALFCTHAKSNSFVFRRFRTLSQKHPGVGGTSAPSTSVQQKKEPQSCRVPLESRPCCRGGHGPRITFPQVAALHPECYDLVFHDSR